ncbi:MAG: hypothetical protein BWY95_00953 [Bacteroidetes bacterium ADurb.BinA104]|nr:MAG: hypothetical protein BWY95_00953 [Bacteroidetes bacterium ADurb.BinA104]
MQFVKVSADRKELQRIAVWLMELYIPFKYTYDNTLIIDYWVFVNKAMPDIFTTFPTMKYEVVDTTRR